MAFGLRRKEDVTEKPYLLAITDELSTEHRYEVFAADIWSAVLKVAKSIDNCDRFDKDYPIRVYAREFGSNTKQYQVVATVVWIPSGLPAITEMKYFDKSV